MSGLPSCLQEDSVVSGYYEGTGFHPPLRAPTRTVGASDPRKQLGLEVVPSVSGPYELMGAKPTTPDAGGTLDVGILARTPDGRRVVIGEIWAACPGKDGVKIRIAAREIAQRMIDTLNGAEAT